jgi:hypothetical protein
VDSGRFVAKATIIGIRDTFSERVKGEMTKATEAYTSGKLSATEWQAAMRANIKSSTVASYELGKGGKEQMTPRDYGKLGRDLRDQYKYLDKFAADVPLMTPEGIANRASLYAEVAIGAFEEGRAEGLRVAGVTTGTWRTVDDPCPECSPLDGTTVNLTTDDLPPLHPRCRCFVD